MALELGDTVPHFEAKDADGNIFDSGSVIGKKAAVIYFYPKDETSICTAQACSFRDNYQDFIDLGAEVIGISADSVASHLKFRSKYRLPFILLSDHDKKLRKLFGVPNSLIVIPGRQTYVIDKTGKVQMVFNSTSGAVHIGKALDCLRQL